MQIKVLYFASFREVVGNAKESFELKDGSTLKTFIEQLLSNHPKLKELWAFAIVTVNKKYVKDETTLKDGDEIGILPPISGG
jgi:molybdopterin converting factor subunit 1